METLNREGDFVFHHTLFIGGRHRVADVHVYRDDPIEGESFEIEAVMIGRRNVLPVLGIDRIHTLEMAKRYWIARGRREAEMSKYEHQMEV